MSDLPVVSTATGCHHPNDPRLTVFANWPWDESGLFNELVKTELPKGERRFGDGAVGQPKGWWVTPAQLDRLVELLVERYGRVQLETEDGTVMLGPGGEVIEDEQQALF